jgi:26 proteasome complex subunit DSS1
MADQKDASMAIDGNQGEKKEASQPQLGVLEEDDEFEEFTVSGALAMCQSDPLLRKWCSYVIKRRIDWKDEDTDVSKLVQLSKTGLTASGGQSSNLWEDNWDDDDVEDDFSKQLRYVLAPCMSTSRETHSFWIREELAKAAKDSEGSDAMQ